MAGSAGWQPSPPQPWGYLATCAWGVLAAAGAAAVASGAIALLFPEQLNSPADPMHDGLVVSLTTIISVTTETVVFIVAARQLDWRVIDYLGLTLPTRRDALVAFGGMVALIMALDLIAVLLGKDVVAPFQDDIYRSARNADALLLLLIAVLIAAPLGEEIMFRGFLFRGWVQKPRDLIPAILLTSGLWAALHSQYEWVGIAQIFVMGLFLGWVRWRSGSTLLVIGLHSLNNIWATLQTIFGNEWSP
jgi:membrane protease YdiL (CAAX protease family)